MKILFYAPNYLPATRYGGPIRSSHGLARALVGLGHEVDVFTTNVDGSDIIDVPTNTRVDIDGVKVRYFDVRVPRRVYYCPAMGRALEREIGAFDVVHTNGMFLWPGPKVARAAQRGGTALVVSPRGMLVRELIAGKSALFKNVWIHLFERRALACAAAIHVTSDDEAENVARLGLDLAPLVVVGNGVDPPVDPPSEREIDALWGGVKEGQRVAFLGRLDWTKGVDLAIEAIFEIPGSTLLIAGHDQIGLRTELERRIKSMGAQDRIRFIGPVEGNAKWAFLTGADVLVVPSIKESFGMAVGEALAVGTPVVCSEGVGAASIVRRIDSTCVVARTARDLSATVKALLGDDERRADYGLQAREIMASEYTWPAIALQMVQVYERARANVARSGASS